MQIESRGAIDKLKEQEIVNRKHIEKLLATSKKGLTINDFENETGLTWQTIKRHLDKLVIIGRVHVDFYGKTQVFFWNGVGKFQKQVAFGSHRLFIDSMISPWGEPFVRIKDTKKVGNEWKDMGAIIVDHNKIDDIVKALGEMKSHMKEYKTDSN